MIIRSDAQSFQVSDQARKISTRLRLGVCSPDVLFREWSALGIWKPFRVLVTLTAKVGDSLPARKREVTLCTSFHRPAREVVIWLITPLAVQNVRPECRSVKIGSHRRQTFVVDGSHNRVAVSTVKGLAQPDGATTQRRHRYGVTVR